MFTVISTQHRENYASHDWDGQGVCPQYWKNKGGSTYILDGNMNTAAIDAAIARIEKQDDYFAESVIDLVKTETPEDFYEEWESPINVTRTSDGKYRATLENEYGTKTWEMLLMGDRADYKFVPAEKV